MGVINIPFYTYKCPECNTKEEIFRQMKDVGEFPKCDICGVIMIRDFASDNVHAVASHYHKEIVSDSLAVSISQIEEHKRLFPDIKMTDEGQPVFDNYSRHNAYLEKTGFIKSPQKIKRKRIN